jgi:hypothetical protein
MSDYAPPENETPPDRSSPLPGRAIVPTPEEAVPQDSSSLLLDEQAKAFAPGSLDQIQANPVVEDADKACREATGKSQASILQMVRETETQGVSFMQGSIRKAWTRSYMAYRNEHPLGSKFLSERFKSRSKLFKPKTRAAVRKNQAAAAGSLFGNADVVVVSAQDDSDPIQRASASLKKELLNYRLDRANTMAAIPWFQVAMGAHQDAQLTGICLSKQYWKYRERTDKATGQTYPVMDRPDCLLIPPECAVFDPNCEWTDPAQTSLYFYVRYPMAIAEIEERMNAAGTADAPQWLDVSREELEGYASGAPVDIETTRRAREGGRQTATENGAQGAFKVLWVYEVFLTIDGEDYTFFSLGPQRLLSVPKCTRDAYPALFGQRPYVLGHGALEPHKAIPTSLVESWQQLQQEANEIVNLRIEQMKQVVNPIAKVRRGRQVDINALQSRTADKPLLLTDPGPAGDVIWDRPPDVPPSAYQEANYINNDFDELSGSFSTSSVQSNRSLNETVGGMRLLSGAATTVTEFDLKVWVETWVERVLSQLLKLIEFYESDERVLVICGQRAELSQTFGITAITDKLLMYDVSLRVNAGMGAGDPMQRLAKFGQVTAMLQPIFQGAAQLGMSVPEPNFEEIVDEAYGMAGWKHAHDRFFKAPEEKPPAGPPPPTPQDELKAKELEQKAQIETQRLALQKEKQDADVAAKARELDLKAEDLQVNRANAVSGLAHQKTNDDRNHILAAKEAGHQHAMSLRQQEHAERAFARTQGHTEQSGARQQDHVERAFDRTQGHTEGAFDRTQGHVEQSGVRQQNHTERHADRTQTHAEIAAARDHELKTRAQDHTEADTGEARKIERDKLDDGREARGVEDAFRRDEKGVKRATKTKSELDEDERQNARIEKTEAILAQLAEALQGMGKGLAQLADAHTSPKEVTLDNGRTARISHARREAA